MAHRIEIPIRTHEEFGHSLAKLLKVVSEIVSCTDNEIELDFG